MSLSCSHTSRLVFHGGCVVTARMLRRLSAMTACMWRCLEVMGVLLGRWERFKLALCPGILKSKRRSCFQYQRDVGCVCKLNDRIRPLQLFSVPLQGFWSWPEMSLRKRPWWCHVTVWRFFHSWAVCAYRWLKRFGEPTHCLAGRLSRAQGARDIPEG